MEILLAAILILFAPVNSEGQSTKPMSLREAVDLALQNNRMLKVRKLQVNEKLQKINEDKVKYLPVIGLGGSYQYNSNLPGLTIEKGRFGVLPLGTITIPLPSSDEVFEMGKHNVYNAGVTFYQPLTQLGKINAGVKYSRTEMQIAETEEAKTVLLVRQGVEKLFFGLLIVKKQTEEAEIKVQMAKSKLRDAENALSAGKTIESSIYGLSASVADEEQNLLKLRIQFVDYMADLIQMTGLDPGDVIVPGPVPVEEIIEDTGLTDPLSKEAVEANNDIRLATLNRTKADYSIRASKFSYLPDVGILGGYTYQEGMDIYPRNNTYIGASLKWNLNDVLSNRMIQKQRVFLRQQAEENLINTRDQVLRDLSRAYRKLNQARELINVAGKVTEYRREDLKVQGDRYRTGMCLESDLLTAKAALAKAESDLFAAQLNYRIALSEMKMLTGSF